MSVVIICFDVPKYLSCVLFASLIASAFTKELRTLVAFLTRRFVCMCAAGKISRLAGNHLGDIPCVIACVEWLGTAQRLQEHSTQLRQKLTNDCAHAMGMGMSRRLTPPTFSS